MRKTKILQGKRFKFDFFGTLPAMRDGHNCSPAETIDIKKSDLFLEKRKWGLKLSKKKQKKRFVLLQSSSKWTILLWFIKKLHSIMVFRPHNINTAEQESSFVSESKFWKEQCLVDERFLRKIHYITSGE